MNSHDRQSRRTQAAAERHEMDRMRQAFMDELQCRQVKWSPYHVNRLLLATGERPERIAELRALLAMMGLGNSWLNFPRLTPSPSGLWDHGEIFSRDRLPCILVGHPYHIQECHRVLFPEIRRFPSLKLAVNDLPSYYGHGTHHVRLELVDARKPYKQFPATWKTRDAHWRLQAAFAEEMGIQAT